jgi:DNA repair exonuclease SbcCD ATPase subunit
MFRAATEILERVNAELVSAISRFQPEHAHASAIKAEEVASLRNEICRAANCLREAPGSTQNDHALQQQISDFRDHLQQLKEALPALQTRLLAEQANLSKQQAQFNAAAAWIQANRKTL